MNGLLTVILNNLFELVLVVNVVTEDGVAVEVNRNVAHILVFRQDTPVLGSYLCESFQDHVLINFVVKIILLVKIIEDLTISIHEGAHSTAHADIDNNVVHG